MTGTTGENNWRQLDNWTQWKISRRRRVDGRIRLFGEILVARKLCMKEVRFQWEYGYQFSWCKRNSSYGLGKKSYDVPSDELSSSGSVENW